MDIEIKEKSFEKYFGHELARLTNVTFSPDQVDENILGFDEAFLMGHPSMHRGFPFRRYSRLARLMGMPLSALPHLTATFLARMPPFRFNLFVQYKRPEYMVLPSASQWADWGTKYYRYSTTPHQQSLLEKIEDVSHRRAATIYASPAIWSATDFFLHAERQEIVENSNIASVARLMGHSLYSYVAPGFKGIAHSDPIDVVSPSLEEIIRGGMESEALPFAEHLKRAAALLTETIGLSETDSALFRNARAALIRGEAPGTARGDIPEAGSLDDALLSIEAFSDAFDTAYYAIG